LKAPSITVFIFAFPCYSNPCFIFLRTLCSSYYAPSITLFLPVIQLFPSTWKIESSFNNSIHLYLSWLFKSLIHIPRERYNLVNRLQ
jgi:hypothetical protein